MLIEMQFLYIEFIYMNNQVVRVDIRKSSRLSSNNLLTESGCTRELWVARNLYSKEGKRYLEKCNLISILPYIHSLLYTNVLSHLADCLGFPSH